jgi:hypothetical protein
MLPPTYQKKNDVKRIDYGNIMKEVWRQWKVQAIFGEYIQHSE